RDTHESAQREARQLANAARQPEYLAGSDAALARFVSQAHLDAYLQGRRVVRSLLVQAYRDALAVDRVHPGKVLRDGARLVRLQLAGEMPDQIQIGERGHLRNRFLQVVLAEIDLTGLRERTDRIGRVPLADRDEPHLVRCATELRCCGCDARPGFEKPTSQMIAIH